MMRHLVMATVLVPLVSCGGGTRTFDVLVNQEQICRTFDPTPESCAMTNSATVSMKLTVEDRDNNRSILYGRADTTSERVYMATRNTDGRYEVVEERVERNANTGCVTVTRLILVLDVDDGGMDGGEEVRIEEDRRCNESNQRRVTRRLREWKGSRVDAERDPNGFTGL